ncbi:MAG: 23S rRNA (uracil(1939)-C(5))-methyltransferase RlmD [bacterium]
MNSNNKSPLQKNQELEVEVVDLGINAEGIAKLDNFTIFIPFALPLERVRIKIIKLKKNYAIAKLLDILTPSPHRVEPSCPYFMKCGGCNLLHLEYSQQLIFKANLIKANLFKIAKLSTSSDTDSSISSVGSIEVLPTIGMENPLFYRNKASLPIRANISSTGYSTGFFKSRSHSIVEISNCLLHSNINDIVIALLKRFIHISAISIFNEKDNSGILKHIITRLNHKNQLMIILVLNTNSNSNYMLENSKKFQDILADLIFNSHAIEVVSIIFNFNTLNNNVILGDKFISIYGADYIQDEINGIAYNISPISFFQVNRSQTAILYSIILDLLDTLNLNPNTSIVFDLYCGIGTITLAIASKVKFAYGVEVVNSAINSANQNAILNNISNVEFICGKSEDVIFSLIQNRSIIPDLIILDPPRKGCDSELISSIICSQIKSIIYVSCDNATFSRDLSILQEQGYELSYIQPLDMFPLTYHVELIALIQKKI